MDPLEILRGQLIKLAEQRAALSKEMRAVLEVATAAGRTELLADEQSKYDEKRGELVKLDGQIDTVQTRVKDLEDDERRADTAAGILAAAGQTGDRRSGGAVVTSEPMTYSRHSGHSYFHDMARAQFRADHTAQERLNRHAAELRVELPEREKRREERARRQMDEIATAERWRDEQRAAAFEQRVNPNRTDGQGGYFVPPLWLIDEAIGLPRFGRPIADSVRNLELPGGTDSINLPKVATGTSTAAQTADGASVSSTDMTDISVSASVYTVAGQQDVSMQLLDQSPAPGFDSIVFTDLQGDLALRQDVYVINGSGSSGQPTGILNVSSPNAITYTDATPTLQEMWVPWIQSVSQVATNRKLPPTATFVVPAIWYWACSQLDGSGGTSGRPLIIPVQNGPFNAMALQTGAVSEGPVGMLTVGQPVILDGNIPTNLGGGSNETRILTLRTSDLYLWEGAIQTRALTEVLSGTLQVRFQIYRYAAFMGNRLSKAISIVSGTGMIPTAGF
jgi:HK97 family phage major capsid protein